MGLDTQERRMAAASTARPWMRATFPTGTVDAEERASAGNTYAGNPFGVLPSPTDPGLEYSVSGRLHYTAPPGRLHYATPSGRLHYTTPSGRTHYTAPDGRIHYTARAD